MGVNQSLIFGNYFKPLAELFRLFEQLSADTVRPSELHLSFWCVLFVFCFFQVKGSQCSKSPRRCSSSLLLLQCKFPMLPFQCYANANILIAPSRFSTTRQRVFFFLHSVYYCYNSPLCRTWNSFWYIFHLFLFIYLLLLVFCLTNRLRLSGPPEIWTPRPAWPLEKR